MIEWRRGDGTKWHMMKPRHITRYHETECGIGAASMWLSMERANEHSACKKCWKAHIKATNQEESE